MNTLLNDLRYALRQLRKSPGFTVTGVLTLALGIGATSAIYTVVDSVVLQPLPFRHFHRLVSLEISTISQGQKNTTPLNPTLYALYKQLCPAFKDIAIYLGGSYGLTTGKGGAPEEVGVLRVSESFFRVLGSAPRLGRTFTHNEFAEDHNSVAVISNNLWQRVFHSDPNIIGKSVVLTGIPLTVVGVMPASVRIPPELIGFTTSGVRRGADVYIPLIVPPSQFQNPTSDFNYVAVARLRAGVTLAQADAQMNTVIEPIVAKQGGDFQAHAFAVPLRQAIDGEAAQGLWLLFGAVGCVLLIACVNLANIQLARGRARGHEHAVRAALGASGNQLFRYSLMESMVLAVIGGAAGIFLAITGVHAFLMMAPHDLPRLEQVHVRFATLAITGLLSIGTGLFFGLAPAWTALRIDPQKAMYEGGVRVAGSHGRRRFRFLLIALEMAACTVLLMGAALLTRSFLHLLNTHLGFSPEHVIAAEVDLTDKHFDDDKARIQFYERVLPILRHLPGAKSASLVSGLHMQGDIWVSGMSIAGDVRPPANIPEANYRWISPGYLHTIEVPLVKGRMLIDADLGTGNVVISESAARAAWPNQNPIGQKFTRNDDRLTVVGVVADTRSRGFTSPADLMVYEPYSLMPPSSGYLMVRAVGNPKALTGDIQRAIRNVDPAVPIPEIRTLPGIIRESVALENFEMSLLLAFGVVALGLAALGVYGVLAVTVAERTRELAVRIALGADKWRIARHVLKEAMQPALWGLAVGLLLAWDVARIAQALLPDEVPYDPIAFVITTVLLLAVVLAACWLPARRAASVDPMQALRSE